MAVGVGDRFVARKTFVEGRNTKFVFFLPLLKRLLLAISYLSEAHEAICFLVIF